MGHLQKTEVVPPQTAEAKCLTEKSCDGTGQNQSSEEAEVLTTKPQRPPRTTEWVQIKNLVLLDFGELSRVVPSRLGIWSHLGTGGIPHCAGSNGREGYSAGYTSQIFRKSTGTLPCLGNGIMVGSENQVPQHPERHGIAHATSAARQKDWRISWLG
jgi:hypothetical protein